MTPSEIFAATLTSSARSGTFDRDQLVSEACDLTRHLRDKGTTPEGTLKEVKQLLSGQMVSPSDKMKQDIVTNCIVTFFEP